MRERLSRRSVAQDRMGMGQVIGVDIYENEVHAVRAAQLGHSEPYPAARACNQSGGEIWLT
ncbi:hypothetical protein RJZ57_005143, partial [Blastomyces gilchristii]